jgi:transcriptional regulator with XRE-family HTH domain
MDKIILEIKKEAQKQGLSETKLAEKAGVHQKTMNRLLRGDTKRLDMELIQKIHTALGMRPEVVSEPSTTYGDPLRVALEDELNKLPRAELAKLLHQLLEKGREQGD